MIHLYKVECWPSDVPFQMEPDNHRVYPAEFETGSEPTADANRT